MLRHFHYWCQKVLPLVYDDSLSYYEVLCKVVKYINDLITQDKIFGDELLNLSKDLSKVQSFVDNYDTSFAKEIIESHLATMIFVEINSDGYIVYNIPDSWDDITFRTTELDYHTNLQTEYGHLVLLY